MVVTATIEEAQPVYGSWIPRAEKPQHRGAESIARRPRSMLHPVVSVFGQCLKGCWPSGHERSG